MMHAVRHFLCRCIFVLMIRHGLMARNIPEDLFPEAVVKILRGNNVVLSVYGKCNPERFETSLYVKTGLLVLSERNICAPELAFTKPWAALVEHRPRECNMSLGQKMKYYRNATVVLVYPNRRDSDVHLNFIHFADVPTVFLSNADGLQIVKLAVNSTALLRVSINVTSGSIHKKNEEEANGLPAVLAIVLGILGLSGICLIGYYAQISPDCLKRKRGVEVSAENRKAVSRIPLKKLRDGDKELEAECAICLGNYKPQDKVKILSCSHVFHKTCIKSWLLRYGGQCCPICKLPAFGSQTLDTCHRDEFPIDPEAPSTSGTSASNSFTTENIRVQMTYIPVVVDVHVGAKRERIRVKTASYCLEDSSLESMVSIKDSSVGKMERGFVVVTPSKKVHWGGEFVHLL